MAVKTRRVFKRVERGQILKAYGALGSLVVWYTKHIDPSATFTATVYNNMVALRTSLLALKNATYQHP